MCKKDGAMKKLTTIQESTTPIAEKERLNSTCRRNWGLCAVMYRHAPSPNLDRCTDRADRLRFKEAPGASTVPER
jgi:hypothetical protein